jgi:hypothetical protein
MSLPPLVRLVQAAYTAKDCIDQVHDQASLETAFQAVTNLALVAVETPHATHQTAMAQEPGIPVLKGLLAELTTVTAQAETARLAAAS